MKKRTISRDAFIDGIEGLLDRFQKAGGDPAFIISAWIISVSVAAMDSPGKTRAALKGHLRKQGSNLKAAARALEDMKSAVLRLKGAGFDGDRFVVEEESAGFSKGLQQTLRAYELDQAATKKQGPRPERMRYVMTAALINYLTDRNVGTVNWRWSFIGDWSALVACFWDHLHDARGLRRFLDALGPVDRRLNRQRLRQALNVTLPLEVVTADTMDLKRWWETRATKSPDLLSQDARGIGAAVAAAWPRNKASGIPQPTSAKIRRRPRSSVG